jgi:hypothetical protein
MSNKVFLEDSDFENKRLNKSFFTNIVKGISVQEFKENYPNDKFEILEKGLVESWIKEVYETTGGEIVKGSFNDNAEVSEVLEHMKSQVSLLKGVLVDTDAGIKEIFVMPKQEIEEESTTGLEKGREDELGDNQLEKGKVRDALFYSEFKINFTKTGKDIKVKLAAIKAIEGAKVASIETALNEIKNEMTYQPTEVYSSEDDNYGYKTFKWDMTYKDSSASGNNVIQFNDTASGTLSQAECDLHRKWNDTVYQYRECKKELDAIELLEENIEDSKKYELSARQMLSFGF